MVSFLNIFTLVLLFSQLILSIALTSEVIIYKLDSLESQSSGITKIFNIKEHETLQDISVLGWLKITYSDTARDILEIKGLSNSQNYSENLIRDFIFYLQYLNWGTPKLKFGWYINHKEEYSYVELSSEEQNTWMFVYFGHSFQNLKQTYYLKFKFNEQMVTKPVSKIENLEFCKISAGVGHYDDKEFISGKIERLTVLTGKGAYKESDFAEFSIHPDNVTGCAIGFVQCGYIGQPIDLCRGLEKPKSVLLQGMDSVMICAHHREIKVKKDIHCIDDDRDLISLHMANAIDFSDNPNDQCDKN